MTSTHEGPPDRERLGSIFLALDALGDGNVLLELTWASGSPWVPQGSLALGSNDDRLSHMSSRQLAENVIVQLRIVLQGMLAENWPPF